MGLEVMMNYYKKPDASPVGIIEGVHVKNFGRSSGLYKGLRGDRGVLLEFAIKLPKVPKPGVIFSFGTPSRGTTFGFNANSHLMLYSGREKWQQRGGKGRYAIKITIPPTDPKISRFMNNKVHNISIAIFPTEVLRSKTQFPHMLSLYIDNTYITGVDGNMADDIWFEDPKNIDSTSLKEEGAFGFMLGIPRILQDRNYRIVAKDFGTEKQYQFGDAVRFYMTWDPKRLAVKSPPTPPLPPLDCKISTTNSCAVDDCALKTCERRFTEINTSLEEMKMEQDAYNLMYSDREQEIIDHDAKRRQFIADEMEPIRGIPRKKREIAKRNELQLLDWDKKNPVPARLAPLAPLTLNLGEIVCATCTQCSEFSDITANDVSFENINQTMNCLNKMREKANEPIAPQAPQAPNRPEPLEQPQEEADVDDDLSALLLEEDPLQQNSEESDNEQQTAIILGGLLIVVVAGAFYIMRNNL